MVWARTTAGEWGCYMVWESGEELWPPEGFDLGLKGSARGISEDQGRYGGMEGHVCKASLRYQGSQGKRLRKQGQRGRGGQQATENAKGQGDLRRAVQWGPRLPPSQTRAVSSSLETWAGGLQVQRGV